MKLEFLKKEGNDRLILIFAGWSTGASFYSGIDRQGWDVAVASGYSDLAFDTEALKSYATVYVFAWSLGVWAAGLVLPKSMVTHAVAVNGTPSPCHDTLGIPQAIFHGTMENLDERNLRKFRRRMAADSDEWKVIEEKTADTPDDIGVLKSELEFIARESAGATSVSAFEWSRVYISDNDRIIPPANQLNAWRMNGAGEVITLPGAHFRDLSTIIRSTIQDTAKVGKRFEAATPTYDEAATAQRRIASRLTELLRSHKPGTGGRMLEIGPGTGILTGMMAGLLHPAAIDYVELYEVEPRGLAAEERAFTADAERWIAHSGDSYEYIVSASTLQWMVNLRRFLRDASERLRPGGMLACSTFVCGNLAELNPARPYGLLYHTEEQIRKMAEECFAEVETATEVIRLTFPTAREALMHLKHTGVGGSSRSQEGLQRLLSAITASGTPQLTYRPLYLLCRK